MKAELCSGRSGPSGRRPPTAVRPSALRRFRSPDGSHRESASSTWTSPTSSSTSPPLALRPSASSTFSSPSLLPPSASLPSVSPREGGGGFEALLDCAAGFAGGAACETPLAIARSRHANNEKTSCHRPNNSRGMLPLAFNTAPGYQGPHGEARVATDPLFSISPLDIPV